MLFFTLAATSCRHPGSTPQVSRGPHPADYYPLAVGNRWRYAARFLGEARKTEVEILRKVDGYFEDSQGGRLIVDSFGVRDEKRYLLREPLEEGRGWSNVVSVSSVEHYKVLAVGERCVVPAGTFEGCVRIEGRNRVDDRTTLVNEMTFAPHVGVVRVRMVAQTRGKEVPQTELLLESFEAAR